MNFNSSMVRLRVTTDYNIRTDIGMAKKVYLLKYETGSWDNWNWHIAGVYLTKERCQIAKDEFELRTKSLRPPLAQRIVNVDIVEWVVNEITYPIELHHEK